MRYKLEYVFLILLILNEFQCFGQYKKIKYKDWDGSESELISYEKKEDKICLTIVLKEKIDTVTLVFNPVTAEAEKLYQHILSFAHSNESYVLRTEENGYKLFYTKFRAPYKTDNGTMATYYDYFFEEKLIPVTTKN